MNPEYYLAVAYVMRHTAEYLERKAHDPTLSQMAIDGALRWIADPKLIIDKTASLVRCDKEISAIEQYKPASKMESFLVTLGITDWEHERHLIFEQMSVATAAAILAREAARKRKRSSGVGTLLLQESENTQRAIPV